MTRAVHAEELGCPRFWVAEHHAVPGIASGSPAVPWRVVVGGPDLASDEMARALRDYRRTFRPWRGSTPSVTSSRSRGLGPGAGSPHR